MRDRWKRLCAVALAAAMTVTMLPVNAQAESRAGETQMETVELVPNGNFESGIDGWSGFSGATIATEQMIVSGDDTSNVLHVSGRNNTSGGAGYDLSGKLKKGTKYTITGKFLYKSGPDKKDFNVTFQNGPDYRYREAKYGAIKGIKDQWVSFRVEYTPADTVVEGVTYPFSTTENTFFIESGWASKPTAENDFMDYWIDDVSITYQKAAGEEPEEPEEPEQPQVEDLLFNGSFENTPIDVNWKGMGGAKVERVEGVAHEGNASLKVSNYTQGWEGVRYELLQLWNEGNLVPGKKYTLTAWAKAENGSGTLTPTIKGQVSGKDSYTGFGSAAQVDSTKWTKISGEINLADYDKDTNVLEVYWSWGKIEEGTPTVFYLDDVTLTTPSDNIVRNGSFERGLESWTGYEQGETDILAVAADEYNSGSQSVKVTNRTKCTNGPAQDMSKKLTPGSYYTVSAWVKYKEGPDTKDFNLTLHNGTESTVLATGTAKKGEWTEIKGDWGMPYDMAADSNFLVVETPTVATPNADNDLMDFYVDDVSVIKYQDNTQALAKKFGYGNPITTNEFGADPYAIEYNGRIYVYMTADDYEFSDKDNPYSNNFGYITSLRVVSSADLMNWTDHGEIEVAGLNGGNGPAMWASHSWAPAIAYKKVDGKDKFFLYFANDASGIGVLEADTPLGPWRDPIGKALITKQTPGCEKVEWCFDPAVLVDDDGEAYIYFGGGVPAGQHNNPKTARVAKLGADMISLDGAAVEIDAPCMFEDSGIFKFGDKYYYSYCSNFTQTTVEGYPEQGTICYMVSDNPMGPFKYEGEIFSNPQVWFGVGGNNHHATFVFNNKSYFIYHAQTVSKALGVERGYRSTHIDEIKLDDKGKILPISGTYEGIPQLAVMDPYQRIEAETIAWNAGVKATATGRPGNLFTDYNMVLTDLQEDDWTSVSQLDFGSKGADKITVAVGSKDGGTIEVRAGYPEGKTIGTIDVPETGSNHTYQLVTGDIEKVTGTQNIFLIFHEKKTGATTEIYQENLANLWAAVKAAESSLPLKEQLQRQITKAHNVSSGFAWNEEDKKNALEAKISDANAVANNDSATDEQLKSAIDTLNQAIDTADQYKPTEKLLKEKLKYRIKYAQQLSELASLSDAHKKQLQTGIDTSKKLLKDDSIMNVDYFQFTEEGGNAPSEGDKTDKEQLTDKITAAKDLLADLSAEKKAALQKVIEEVEAVLKNENASEADIKAALDKLNKAIEDSEKDTPKEELSSQIVAAKALLDSLSEEKKAALQAVIDEVEAILNNANASEADIQAALDKLNKAIEDAGGDKPPVEKPVKDQLEEKIAAAKELLANLSAEKKEALQAVIDEIEALLKNENASEADLKAALDKLNKAIEDAGVEKPVKDQLDEKIAAAKELLANLSEEKKAALQAVIDEIEALLKNENVSEADLKAALDKLNKAIEDAGVEKPVKDQLDEKIAAAKELLANLSEEKKAALQAVIDEIEALLKNENVSEADLKAALDKLNKAIEDAGVEKPVKDQLNEKITAAKKLLANLSAAKKAALQKVIDEVEAVWKDANASEADLKAALEKLNKAIEEANKPVVNPPVATPRVGEKFTMSNGLKYKITAYSSKTKKVTVTGTSKKNVTSISVPATVKYKNVTFKVTSIDKNAFTKKSKLKSATIGKYVTSIGAKAFYNDKNLAKVTFNGTAVKTIGKDAFKGIKKGASFVMKKKTFTSKSVKYKITKSTTSAKEVTVTGTSKKNITSLNIPATVKYNGMSYKVTAIDKNAFKSKKKLKSITIGKNVKNIGASAFAKDSRLTTIIIKSTVLKKVGSKAFSGISKKAKIKVPAKKLKAYKRLLKNKGQSKSVKIVKL